MNSIAPGGLAGDRRAVVPGSGFPFSTHEIWKIIKENKDLDLPTHKVPHFPALKTCILCICVCNVHMDIDINKMVFVFLNMYVWILGQCISIL